MTTTSWTDVEKKEMVASIQYVRGRLAVCDVNRFVYRDPIQTITIKDNKIKNRTSFFVRST